MTTPSLGTPVRVFGYAGYPNIPVPPTGSSPAGLVFATGENAVLFFIGSPGGTNAVSGVVIDFGSGNVTVPLLGSQVASSTAASVYVYGIAVPAPGTYQAEVTFVNGYTTSSIIAVPVSDANVASLIRSGTLAGQSYSIRTSPDVLALGGTVNAADQMVSVAYLDSSHGADTISTPSGETVLDAWTNDPTVGKLIVTYGVGKASSSIGFSGSGTAQASHLAFALQIPAAPNTAPTFTGHIGDIVASQSVAISPVATSGEFSDTGDTLTYSKSPAGTTWPTGLAINASTGAITGTMATAATTTGLKVRATDTASQTVDSNAFSVTVNAGAPRSIHLLMAGSGSRANLTGLKWSLHLQTSPDAFSTAPCDRGNSGTTDSSSYFDGSFPGAAAAGAIAGDHAWLTITNSNGDPAQSPPCWTFSAPVTLA